LPGAYPASKEAAWQLGCSPGTVQTYWRRVLRKTGTASQSELFAALFRFVLAGGSPPRQDPWPCGIHDIATRRSSDINNQGLVLLPRSRSGSRRPDIEVACELARTPPDLQIQFASYATGGATLRAAELPVIDMGLDDDTPFLEGLGRASRIIATE
jgi:hypothetical protein